jgi:hypothetical protein
VGALSECKKCISSKTNFAKKGEKKCERFKIGRTCPGLPWLPELPPSAKKEKYCF